MNIKNIEATNREKSKKFSAFFRDIRLKNGWSVRKLAQTLELSAVYVSDLERGNRLPTLAIVQKISKNLVLTDEEKETLEISYLCAHPTVVIPHKLLEYIIENNLVESMNELISTDPEGIKIKKIAKEK